MTRQPIRPADTAGAGLSWAVTAGKLLTMAAADNYTLTVPATMIVAGRNVANTFTAGQTITSPTLTQNALIIKTTDDNTTKNLIEMQNSAGNLLANMTADGKFYLSNVTPSVPSYFYLQKSGALASGTSYLSYYNSVFSANAAGSALRAMQMTTTGNGSNNFSDLASITLTTTNSMTAGTVTAQNGVSVANTITGASNTTNVYGYRTFISLSSTGSVTEYFGFESRAPSISGAGTLGFAYGYYCANLGNAKITGAYAIYVAGQTGATNNYAIYTNAGLVRFGDQTLIVGSADKVQAIIRGYSTQTTNALEIQASAGAVNVSVDNSGGVVINEQGNAAGDFRVESDTEANMIFLDANGDTDGALYLGGSTNGIKINKGGELVLIGTATVWDDLRIEPVARNSGAKAPSFVNWINGLYLYDFDDAAVASEKEIFFTVQLSHSWKEGSAVEPHVHWTNKTTGTAGHVVRWGLEYSKAKIGGTFGASTTVYGTTIAGGGDITVANEHMLTDFDPIDMTGDTVSTVLVCRLFRNSSNAADTYTGTAGLLYIDWHILLDSMGSKTEFVK